MRRPSHGFARTIALVSLCWLAFPSLLAAQEASTGLVFHASADPLPLTFTVEEGEARAKASAVLTNRTTALESITLSLVDLSTGERHDAGAGGVTRLEIATNPPPIRPGRTIVIAFTIAVPATTRAFDGLLVAVGANRATPDAILRVSGSVPQPAPASVLGAASLQPEALAITATRWGPFEVKASECWAWPPADGDAFRVHAAGLGELPDPSASPNPSAAVPQPQTYLASDTGSRLFANLHIVNAAGGRHLAVGLGCARAAGTYTGAIVLDPGNEKSPKLGLTVKVQDFVLFPLLAVFAGAHIAYLLKMWADRNRPERILRASLGHARSNYLTASATAHRDDKHLLDDVFDPGEALPNGDTEAAKLTKSARDAGTRDELDDLATAALALMKLGDLYPAIVKARGELRAHVIHRLPMPNAAALRDVDLALLNVTRLKTLDEGNAHLDSVTSQLKAGAMWLRAYGLYTAAVSLYDDLPAKLPSWVADKAALADPRAILAADLRTAATIDDLQDADVLDRLRESLRILSIAHATAPPAPDAETTDGAPRDGSHESFDVPPLVVPSVGSGWTPEREIAMLRLGDRLEFVVVALLAAAVFIGTSYVDKAFGTSWQYLGAFVAGAFGTVLVNFTLLPWYRSYRIKPAAGAAK